MKLQPKSKVNIVEESMDSLVNHLVQLQELTLIRDEQKASSHSAHLEQLNESIDAMTDELPEEEQAIYRKLFKKDHIVIVPVTDDNCTGCGMKLPISLVQVVRQKQGIQRCPNCARILYSAQSAPKRIVKRAKRSAPSKGGVNRFSSVSLMVPEIEADNMDDCIKSFAALMEEEGFISDAEKLADLAMARESVLSTVVDHGLAFPHVRGIEGGALAFAMGKSTAGLSLGDKERGLTHILFFIVIPTAASAFYLKLLAGLTETFRKPEVIEKIMAEKTQLGMWKTLVKLTRSTIK
jgi:mannitol/fructose-specific phosphotransferase system IIA component (Ntr-type)